MWNIVLLELKMIYETYLNYEKVLFKELKIYMILFLLVHINEG